jgi:hypothetical protein
MPVVIGEFETVAETRQGQQSPGATAAEGEDGKAEKVEACAVAAAQRTLAVQSLRVWAH